MASRDKGFTEDPLIGPEAARLKRSCMRGIGQAKQTHALPLRRMGELTGAQEPWTPGGPMAPRDTLVLGSWFLMREIEMASAKVGDVTVAWTAKEFSLTLPCSKSDPRAVGMTRTHGCLCDQSDNGEEDPTCPFHVGWRQLSLARSCCQGEQSDAPLFPCAGGGIPAKVAMQGTIIAAAERLGLRTVGPAGEALFTGHACRRTGAEHFTASGVEIYVTQLFGRWGGATVLRYCQEAPLVGSGALARRTREFTRVSAVAGCGGGSAGPGAKEFKDIRQSMDKLQVASAQASSGIAGLLEEIGALRAKQHELAAGQEMPQRILNPATGVVHVPLLWSARLPPVAWRTRCGWKFGARPFATDIPAEAKICASCLDSAA